MLYFIPDAETRMRVERRDGPEPFTVGYLHFHPSSGEPRLVMSSGITPHLTLGEIGQVNTRLGDAAAGGARRATDG